MNRPFTAEAQHAKHPKPLMAEMQWDEENKEWFAKCPFCSEPSGAIEKPGTYECPCGETFEVYALEPVEGI